jgi:hypothetical protein
VDVGYADKSDRMANSYSVSRCMRKWTKKLLFHLLYLKTLNNQILLKCHGSNLSHRLQACEEYCRAWLTTAQTITQGTVLDYKLDQGLYEKIIRHRELLLIRYVIISLSSLISPTTHHMLSFLFVLHVILAWNT